MSRLMHTSELFCGTFDHRSVGSGTLASVFVTPFSGRVTAFNVVPTVAVTADDSNYYTVNLERYRFGSNVVIATRTTKAADSGAMTINVPWPLSGFDATNKLLQEEDILLCRITRTLGTPTTAMIRTSYNFTVEPE